MKAFAQCNWFPYAEQIQLHCMTDRAFCELFPNNFFWSLSQEPEWIQEAMTSSEDRELVCI
jgi:hypothetical protein